MNTPNMQYSRLWLSPCSLSAPITCTSWCTSWIKTSSGGLSMASYWDSFTSFPRLSWGRPFSLVTPISADGVFLRPRPNCLACPLLACVSFNMYWHFFQNFLKSHSHVDIMEIVQLRNSTNVDALSGYFFCCFSTLYYSDWWGWNFCVCPQMYLKKQGSIASSFGTNSNCYEFLKSTDSQA